MNPVQQCIGVVPTKKYEHALKPYKMYDIHNFESVFQGCIEKAPKDDNASYQAFLEIAAFITSTRFFEVYGLQYKAGILFQYNGFPYLALGNSLMRISPTLQGEYSTMLLIDMNNYIFNKKVEKKLQDLQQAKQRLETATNVFATVSAVAVCIAIYIFLR